MSERIVEGPRGAGKLARALLLAALACATAAPAVAGDKKKPLDPVNCPYCGNDPALLKAAGLVNHGGFLFGKTGADKKVGDTAKVDALLPTCEIRWLETEHHRLGFALGSYKVKLEEKKKIIAELTRLNQVLPKVPIEIGILDPWLRAHMYAQRLEDIYKRFQELIEGGDTKSEGSADTWTGAYHGEGPYLGMQDKYEVLILPNEGSHVEFLREHAGLSIRATQRWHYVDRGVIAVIMHAQQGNLRQDPGLHGHVAFNMAHNLYDGYQHYNYDTPVWMHEGLAHFMEREIDPNNNSFDSGEGAVADMTSKGNWKPDVLKLINSGEAPTMAQLIALKSYSELKLPHHFTTWGIVDYLMTEKKKEFARFLVAMKCHYGEGGMPTGEKLLDWHRQVFKDTLGMSYPEFDVAWREWAKKAYRSSPKTGPEDGKGGPVLPPTGGGVPVPGGG